MSLAYTLNLGLRPSLPSRTILRAVRSPLQSRSIHTTNPFHRRVADTHVIVRSARPSAGRGGQATRTTLYAIGLGTAFIGLSSRAPAQCQSVTARSPAGSGTGGLGEAQPPQSVLSLYELGFGTVAGICSGVFLKKGLRAIAFLLGGAFILLQVSRGETCGELVKRQLYNSLWEVTHRAGHAHARLSVLFLARPIVLIIQSPSPTSR